MEDSLWYTFIGVGNEGLEMCYSNPYKEETLKKMESARLRASFNSHREIELYCWISDYQVTFERLEEDPSFVDFIMEESHNFGF